MGRNRAIQMWVDKDFLKLVREEIRPFLRERAYDTGIIVHVSDAWVTRWLAGKLSRKREKGNEKTMFDDIF